MSHQFADKCLSKLTSYSITAMECKLCGSQLLHFYAICHEYAKLETAILDASSLDFSPSANANDSHHFNRYERNILANLMNDIARVKLSLPFHAEVFLKEIQITSLLFLTNATEFAAVLEMLFDTRTSTPSAINLSFEYTDQKYGIDKVKRIAADCLLLIEKKTIDGQPLSDPILARCHAYLGMTHALMWRLPEAIACFARAIDRVPEDASFLLAFFLQICLPGGGKGGREAGEGCFKMTMKAVSIRRLILCLCLGMTLSRNFNQLDASCRTTVHCLLGNIFHDSLTQLHFQHSGPIPAYLYFSIYHFIYAPNCMNILRVESSEKEEATKGTPSGEVYDKADLIPLLALNAASHFEKVLIIGTLFVSLYFFFHLLFSCS
jgi:hypothetical protein